jgi:hypothetical protein
LTHLTIDKGSAAVYAHGWTKWKPPRSSASAVAYMISKELSGGLNLPPQVTDSTGIPFGGNRHFFLAFDQRLVTPLKLSCRRQSEWTAIPFHFTFITYLSNLCLHHYSVSLGSLLSLHAGGLLSTKCCPRNLVRGQLSTEGQDITLAFKLLKHSQGCGRSRQR